MGLKLLGFCFRGTNGSTVPSSGLKGQSFFWRFYSITKKAAIPCVLFCFLKLPSDLKRLKTEFVDEGVLLPTDEHISALASEYASVWDPNLQGLIVGLWLSVDFVPNKEKRRMKALRFSGSMTHSLQDNRRFTVESFLDLLMNNN